MPHTKQIIHGELLWTDVTNPGREEIVSIAKTYQLNEHLVEDCLQPEHLPKYEWVDDVNFMILRYYSAKDDCLIASIQELTNKIAVFYSEKFLVTIHKTEIPFLEALRNGKGKGLNGYGAGAVVSRIVWYALETFDERVNQLSQKIDSNETGIMLRKAGNNHMEALYIIKREVVLSHKTLLLMLEPINHLRPKAGEESLIQDVKDQHLKVLTLYAQALDEVNNLMNLYMSFSAQKTNEVVKVLTIFSVFFMPLTFIVGIYGMNFEFMPELSAKWGYPGVMVLMIVITISIYAWFKKKNWL